MFDKNWTHFTNQGNQSFTSLRFYNKKWNTYTHRLILLICIGPSLDPDPIECLNLLNDPSKLLSDFLLLSNFFPLICAAGNRAGNVGAVWHLVLSNFSNCSAFRPASTRTSSSMSWLLFVIAFFKAYNL